MEEAIKPPRLLSLIFDLTLGFLALIGTLVLLVLGSGTTAIAAKRLGRKYIGIENNEKFFKIAEERISKEAEEQSLF